MSRPDERIAGVSARLAVVGTHRELEKYKLHLQVSISRRVFSHFNYK